ncbi:response regulator [Ramlibacter sp. G-1-2-2]|uniref:Response regulator n=1 Tax=Ramlibacter agri TaxID=2728837 RepID=A0A848GX27_9BURK|nr:response regulator [Ramlibacter agri]NML43216.1 response regulator [Ramlibacter agri]
MDTEASLVAIVDDEESVRKALGRLVRSAGYEAAVFSSGSDFLQSLQLRLPRCVVLDLRMPRVTGFDVQQGIMRAGAGVPVIIITGDDTTDSRERALRDGARAYLRKPVDDAMLLEAIQGAVRFGAP